MTKNYDHHIAKHIKSVYKKRLLSPIIYLVILLILWLVLPLQHLLFPQKITSVSDLSKYQRQRDSYVQTTLTDLYFTGYTNTLLGQKTGYYYYTMWEDKCVIVLLSPKTCEEGLPMIESAHIRGRILRGNKAFHTLLDSLAEDLDWTTQGISSKLSPYLISEPAFMSVPSTVLMIVYFLTGLYALIRLIADTTYIFFPVLAPACRQLSRFGKPSVLLAQAEEELATLPFDMTSDGKSTVNADFYTFGYPATSTNTQYLTVYAILNDGKKYSFTYDVTEKIHNAPDPANVHILLDGLPLPKPIDNSGGFNPDVDEWSTVEISISM